MPLPATRTAVVVPIRKPVVLSPEQARDPFYVPSNCCPKCLAERTGGQAACSRCGLDYEKASGASFDPPQTVREQWAALWEKWDDPLSHELLRQAALAQGELVPVARLYQLRLARVPGDTHAERGRTEVMRLVSTVATLQRSVPPNTRRIRRLGWGMVMAFVTGLAAAMAKALIAR
jgi:hypothetical protein